MLAALRAEAGKFSDISEFRMSGCTAFSVHGRIAACACGNLIALRLPELSGHRIAANARLQIVPVIRTDVIAALAGIYGDQPSLQYA